MNPKILPLSLVSLSAVLLSAPAQTLALYDAEISNPADGGSGPVLWYSNATTANASGHMNSVGSSTLTAFNLADVTANDYFGNVNYAFGGDPLADGISVSGSISTTFLTQANGTVSFLFQTPSTLSGFQSMFSRGTFGDTSQLEVGLNGTALRLGYENSGNQTVNIGTVAADTWYYFAMRWDTALASNDMTWYFGEMGGSLSSGSVTITSAGDSAESIVMLGRQGSSKFNGVMENVATWDRTLSDQSIQDQFATAIPEPSAGAALFGLSILTFCLLRRRSRTAS